MIDSLSCPSSKLRTFCGLLVYMSVSVSGHIRYSISEELERGAFVGNIARDLGLDVAELSSRNFRLVSQHKDKYLDVNMKTGALVVNDKIDREQLCHQTLECLLKLEAVVENPLKVYSIMIEISDVNDNSPAFDREEFRLDILEMTTPGSRFRLQNAHDPDAGTNSVRAYQLSHNAHFILNGGVAEEQISMPDLVLERPLDREQQTTHRLTLMAIDGGTPQRTGTTQIIISVIDVNDNMPVFEQDIYQVTIAEDAPEGVLLLNVKAVDADEGRNGDVKYYFSENVPESTIKRFRVDSEDGELRLIGRLDFEETQNYYIPIEAKDNGFSALSAYCKVIMKVIDVNDNAPDIVIVSTFSPIREHAPLATAVILFKVTDADSADNGEVSCQIADNLPFKLDRSVNNYFTVVTTRDIDRETITDYNITITCMDAGFPRLYTSKTIQVQISDINDNAPRFTQTEFTFYVEENNVKGASIGVVSAFDPDYSHNGRVTFHILDDLVNELPVLHIVSINSRSGEIYAQQSFDYEQIKKFQIHVQVNDAGFPPLSSNGTVNIIVTDQNDNVPVILSPLSNTGSAVEETISKLADSGYLLAKVIATDADSGQNAQVVYQLLQPTDDSLFTVAPETGEIWTIRRFLQKDSPRQIIKVLVRDNGIPSLSTTVNIKVTVQDGMIENTSKISQMSISWPWKSDVKLYLIISFGTTSLILLLAIVILGVKVQKRGTDISSCCWSISYYSKRNALYGSQKASANLQMRPNYKEGHENYEPAHAFSHDVHPDTDLNDFLFLRLHGTTSPMIHLKAGSCINEESSKGSSNATTEFQEMQVRIKSRCASFIEKRYFLKAAPTRPLTSSTVWRSVLGTRMFLFLPNFKQCLEG
ncbi:protocadherin beta-15-like isoform X2 [Narcine bancroftii]|uniref:protocadherin beta-15-like isoform X2 n=1 Tax=Narcine bancroftii TaxID=1343680 RepID=UPI00383205B3